MPETNVIQQTTNYEVYVEGNRHLGSASVDLPEFNYMTNEQKGSGIAGTIEVPTRGHVEDLEVTIHWRNIFERPVDLTAQDAVLISFRSAVQVYDAAKGITKISAVRVDVRALSAGITLGKLEPSEQSDTESKFKIDYISVMVDGVEILEHDKFNFVHKVNGVDMLADVRAALGI